MSAPQTNVERQKRRHKGPIVGISAGLAFVVLLVLGYGWLSGSSDTITLPQQETTIPTTEPMADPAAPPAPSTEEPAPTSE